LQNPIGLSNGNHQVFFDMFDEWGAELKASRSDVSDEALAAFGQNMFGGEFVFSVSRDFVKGCQNPVIICAGNDQFHPTATAEEIDNLAPNSEFILKWRGGSAANGSKGARFPQKTHPAVGVTSDE
jgi:hypothetical protein